MCVLNWTLNYETQLMLVKYKKMVYSISWEEKVLQYFNTKRNLTENP